MKRIVLLATVFTIVVSIPGAAQRRAPEIDTLLRTAVDQKRVPLVVAMVADSRGIVYEQAVGADNWRGPESTTPSFGSIERSR
jgi:hypothetical protein